MTGKTNPISSQALNLFRNIAGSTFSQTWVSLFSTNPTTDGSSGSSYPVAGTDFVEWSVSNSRVRVNQDTTDPMWTAPVVDPTNGNRMKIDNSASVGWPAIAGLPVGGETVVGVGIFSAQTLGSLLYWDVLITPRLVLNGDEFQFLVGNLIVRED